MQTETILDEIEEAVERQLSIGDGGEAVAEAAASLMAALRPALQQAALQIAEQAAEEVAAQISGYSVNVVLENGEPSMLVREDGGAQRVINDDLSARITLRLPDSLKDELENAAGAAGDSVNAYVIKALASRAARRSSRRITETFET